MVFGKNKLEAYKRQSQYFKNPLKTQNLEEKKMQ
jgi:hypothetical protein